MDTLLLALSQGTLNRGPSSKTAWQRLGNEEAFLKLLPTALVQNMDQHLSQRAQAGKASFCSWQECKIEVPN